jgi:basic membrane protein A and related proteins
MRKLFTRFEILFITVILAAACLPATPTPTPPPTLIPTPTPLPGIDSVCLVTDVGTITDGTFNQYAYEGMLHAATEFEMSEPTYYESTSDEDFIPNINQCIEDGADAIITVGFLLQEATLEAAIANPTVYFIGIDQDFASAENAPDNVTGVQFREDQAGFLVGTLAAIVANEQGSDTIAGIYGIDVPAVVRFRNGFEQGALYINPDWEVGVNILGRYHDSFGDEAAGVQTAQEFIDAGATVIFGAGGPLGSAAIRHAAEQGIYVIGVDKDEYFTTFAEGAAEGSEYLISSALKRVDQGVLDTIGILAEGRYGDFPGGTNYLLDAARGGVGFATAHDADLSEAITTQVSAILQQLISGELETGVDPVTGNLIESSE